MRSRSCARSEVDLTTVHHIQGNTAMNEQFSNVIAGVTAALMVAWVGFEISRRRAKLREVYDVLGSDERAITAALEKMVAEGILKPYR